MNASAVMRAHPGVDRQVVVLVLLIAGAAWLLLSFWHGTGLPSLPSDHAGHDTSHAGHGATGSPPSTGHAVAGVPWLLGWVVMVVAMMLPPALPLFRVVARLVGPLPRPGLLVISAGSAFVAVWAAVGVVLLLIAGLVGHVLALADVAARHPALLSGVAILLAGAYQFTPAKKACLSACRSPVGIVLGTWSRTRPAAVEAGLIGLRYGAVCAGCCWALMVLTLAVGVAAVPVMVVAGVLMALERLLPSTRRLVPAIAAAAVVVGVCVLVGWLPPGLTLT